MGNKESIKRYIVRDVHGNILAENGFSVVGAVHVTAEPGHGEPSADVEYVGGELYITLHNIDGNGITEIITDSQEGDEAVNTVTIKTNDNPEGVVLDVRNGSKGNRGNGITSIVTNESLQDGGINTVTIKTTDNPAGQTFTVRNGSTGPQGETAVYDNSNPPVKVATIKTTLGQSQTDTMTQKAITDTIIHELVSDWEEITEGKGSAHLSIDDSGNISSATNNYTTFWVPCNTGDIFKVVMQNGYSSSSNYKRIAWSANVPADGGASTVIYEINLAAWETVINAPSSGYLCIFGRGINSSTPNVSVYKPVRKFAWVDQLCAGIIQDNAAIRAEFGEIKDGNGMFADADMGDLTGYYINSSNKDVVDSGYDSYVVPVIPGEVYRIAASTIGYAYLQSPLTGSNSAAPYADGYSGRIWPGTESVDVTIPSGANYLFIVAKINGTSTGASLMKQVPAKEVLSEEIEQLRDDVDSVNEQLTITKDVDTSSLLFQNVTINPSNKWNKMTNGSGGIFIPVLAGKTYVLSAPDNWVMYAILSDSSWADGRTPSFVGEQKRKAITAGGSVKFTTPDGARFLYVWNKYASDGTVVDANIRLQTNTPIADVVESISGGSAVEESDVAIKMRRKIVENTFNYLTPLNAPSDANGYEKAQTAQELWVQKKIRQMAVIKWTPKREIPSRQQSDPFSANTEYSGIPYSSVKEKGKYVGIDVSFHTFMTAVNNPYSLLYTENTSSTGSRSAWGVVYQGENCATYYGSVCSAYVCWALGMDMQWQSHFDRWCAERNLNMIKIHDQSAQGLRIGDIYWKDGHDRIVYMIERAADGTVVAVRMAEEANANIVGPGRAVIRPRKEASTFNSDLAAEGAIIYRSTELYKNTYEPCPYVPDTYSGVEEDLESPTYNNDICTYAGDKASFYEGETVVLNHDLDGEHGDWTGIEVYRDDVLVETITLAEYDSSGIDTEIISDLPEHSVVLNDVMELPAGSYKARMVGTGSSASDYTYWEVIDAVASCEWIDDDKTMLKISWDSSNGLAEEWEIGTVFSYIEVQGVITADDRQKGYIVINPFELKREQRMSELDTERTCLKIHFKGEYGRVIGIGTIEY